jgi:antitoxin component of RelBE/YafQ-DinJ toxin-antitoxin module
MARVRMLPRAIRVDEPTWQAALDAAEAKGENLPDVIRAFLKRYARTAPKPTEETQP